jgi:hypothetical protein
VKIVRQVGEPAIGGRIAVEDEQTARVAPDGRRLSDELGREREIVI